MLTGSALSPSTDQLYGRTRNGFEFWRLDPSAVAYILAHHMAFGALGVLQDYIHSHRH